MSSESMSCSCKITIQIPLFNKLNNFLYHFSSNDFNTTKKVNKYQDHSHFPLTSYLFYILHLYITLRFIYFQTHNVCTYMYLYELWYTRQYQIQWFFGLDTE